MTHMTIDDRLDAVLNTLADRVRELRRERDLTVVALSFEAGISESRVRAIESGRTTASLATLVALAETFGIELAELFGETTHGGGDRDSSGRHVAPREETWGGELPPAPWMSDTAAASTPSRYVVPSEVVWGGELPPAPWATPKADPEPSEPTDLPEPIASASAPNRSTEKTWEGPLPTAPWSVEAATVAVTGSNAPAAGHRTASPSAVAGRQESASVRHRDGAARLALVTSDAPTRSREPRTFSDLREGVLEGREFSSLREFAIAAVAEAGYSSLTVARIFRLPVWKLERWIAEKGYMGRR